MRRRTTALALVWPLALAACQIEETPRPEVTAPADLAREEIQKTFAEYQQALLAGDTRRAVAAFTTDAHLYEAGKPDRIGRTDILAGLASATVRAQRTFIAYHSDAIDVVPGGIAYEMGTFEERFRHGDEGEDTRRGHYAVRWVRGAEALWRIHRLMRFTEPVADSVARDTTSS